MNLPSVYLTLEDDVVQIVERIKKLKSPELILVCPKKSLLFNDVINLKLLKKQTDLLGKKIYILTMDENGQSYALEAGFELKFLPKTKAQGTATDIAIKPVVQSQKPAAHKPVVKKVSTPAIPPSVKKTVQQKPVPEAKPEKKAPSKTIVTAIPKVSVKDTVFPEAKEFLKPEVAPSQPVKRRSRRYAMAGLAAIILLALVILTFVVLPRGEVVVYARSEAVARDIEVSMSTANTQPNADQLSMPLAKVSEVLNDEGDFQGSGKKEIGNKAQGTVTIYNFTRLPLNLKAATTVLKYGNNTYSLVSDAMQIKPTAYKDPKTKEVDENSLSAPVEIVATQGGEGFNIPAGTRMEITNQVFGSRPQVLYAKTQTPVTGGVSRFLSVVTDQDINAARDSLAQKMVEELRGKLKDSGLYLADKTYTIQPLDFSTDKPAGTESPSFHAALKIQVTGLAFNQGDLKKLVDERISQTLSANKELDTDQNNITYQLKSIDMNSGSAVFLVHYEGKAVWQVNIDNMQQDMVGKTPEEVNELLKSRPEIDHIDVSLAPAWQKSMPMFENNIRVKVSK